MTTKKAVLLLQMGGPDSISAVRPFLMNLFRDREIIKLGPPWLQPLLARLIVMKRARHVEENYKMIGGGSPLRKMTEEQAAALSRALGGEYLCLPVMRYWNPFAHEAVRQVMREGIKEITVLSLYPHFSRATTGSSLKDLQRTLLEMGCSAPHKIIDCFYDDAGYIEALAEKIKEGLELFHPLAEVEILFSAHSLPQSFIDEGDPYLDQIKTSVKLVMKNFDRPYHLAFQSRAGPVKWLEPSTDGMLEKLAADGVKNLLVVPLSFVSDHIETLHEIDIEYSKKAWKLGIAKFERVPSLNSSEKFISALAAMVKRVNGGC